MKVMIWADDPDLALPVRAKLREDGHTAMIRDARAFAGFGDLESCDALAFVSASKRAFIIAEYSSPAARERYGQVQIIDVETGKFGEVTALPNIAPVEKPPAEPSEKDLLDGRLENLTDDDFRTYVRGITNLDIPADMSRADMEATLRDGKLPEAKPPAQDPPADNTAPPTAAENTTPAKTGRGARAAKSE